MKEIQTFLREFQKEMNWDISNESYPSSKLSLLNNYLLLTTEVGEIAEEFRSMFNQTAKLVKEEQYTEEEAFLFAKERHKENIGKEISDCIAYLVKFANYFEIDLEESFYGKMEEIKGRVNKDQS